MEISSTELTRSISPRVENPRNMKNSGRFATSFVLLEHEDDEAKARREEHLEDLREEVHPVGPGEELAPRTRCKQSYDETRQGENPRRGEEPRLLLSQRQEQEDDGKGEYRKFGKQHHRASPLMG